MASENGASVVSNIQYDVNNTNQRASEPAGGERTNAISSSLTWHTVLEKTIPHQSDTACNLFRTPTVFPTASSFHTNTEECGLQRDSSLVSLSGDVEEQDTNEPDSKIQSVLPQSYNMSLQQKTDLDLDLDNTVCLPRQPDGNVDHVLFIIVVQNYIGIFFIGK